MIFFAMENKIWEQQKEITVFLVGENFPVREKISEMDSVIILTKLVSVRTYTNIYMGKEIILSPTILLVQNVESIWL